MKQMTKKDMKGMQGTEFIYVFSDGDTMPAYVKKFDEKTAKLSCWSFSLVTDQGYKFIPKNEDEKKEGAICLSIGRFFNESRAKLIEIKKTGKIDISNVAKWRDGSFPGCVF